MYPYNILNISPEASNEEVERAYQELRAKYSEDRFLEGEAGRQGALNLESLEVAYAEILRMRSSSKSQSGFGGDSLDAVDEMIKSGNLDGAQEALNSAEKRTDRWHFLQSIVYYKKGWYDESRSQLRLAVTLNPSNSQYKEALTRLENVMASNNTNPNNMGMPPQGAGMGQEGMPNQQPDNAMGLMNCCTTLCIMDCCCNMLRCC